MDFVQLAWNLYPPGCGARHRIVRVPAEFLAAVCRSGPPGVWWRTVEGVPVDARFVTAEYDSVRRQFVVTFAHESFGSYKQADLTPGSPAHEVTVRFRTMEVPEEELA